MALALEPTTRAEAFVEADAGASLEIVHVTVLPAEFVVHVMRTVGAGNDGHGHQGHSGHAGIDQGEQDRGGAHRTWHYAARW